MTKQELIKQTKLELLDFFGLNYPPRTHRHYKSVEALLDEFYTIAQSKAFEEHNELLTENMRWVRLQGQDMGKVFDKIP